jgi:hypothetical protein
VLLMRSLSERIRAHIIPKLSSLSFPILDQAARGLFIKGDSFVPSKIKIPTWQPRDGVAIGKP